jgi:hypothetical protein
VSSSGWGQITPTESLFEIHERRAVSAIGNVNDQQLFALAAVMLIEHVPVPPSMEGQEVSDWGIRAYADVFERLDSAKITTIDIETLIQSQLLEHSIVNSLDGDDDSKDVGSAETYRGSATFGNNGFELFDRLRRLAHLRRTFAPDATDDVRLSQYHLTPAGVITAAFVIETYAAILVDFGSWGLARASRDRLVTQTTATTAETFRAQRRGIISSQRNFVERLIRTGSSVDEKISDSLRRGRHLT